MGAPFLAPIEPAAAVSPLDMPFAAVMSKEAAVQLRESIDVTKSRDMLALYAFLVLDRDAMIAMIKSVADDAGADEAMAVLEAIAGVRDNIAEIDRLAEIVEARAMLAMHVALGLTLEDTAADPGPDDVMRAAWDAADAEEARQRARMDALGSEFTDEEINAVAADWSPARDVLIGTPAPDQVGVLRKFILIWGDGTEPHGCPCAEDVLSFLSDLRRLAGEQA